MIITEKELILLQLISQLFKNEIDEPKGIYLTEVSEFAKELEQNLYSLEESKQKIYLNRVREKFFDWIDGNTVKRVSRKPKTKQEKNLRALVNTVTYSQGVIETNEVRFGLYEKNNQSEDFRKGNVFELERIKIFKIDENPTTFLIDDGKGTYEVNPLPQLNHPYNLTNKDIYNQRGEVHRYTEFQYYISSFAYRLQSSQFQLPNELKKFIDYHFENSEDKDGFLDVLEYSVLDYDFIKNRTQKVELIKDWIKGKKSESKNKPLRKLTWNGTQKNLAELFLELEKKGWIEKIETGQRAKICESIEAIFDLSQTKKSKDTNSLKSFIEIMTPFFDDRTKETSFPKVFSERYKKQFENIKSAKKTT